MTRWHRKTALVTILWVTLAAPGSGTTLLEAPPSTLVDQADLIFSGYVVHTETVLTKDGRFPFTFVTFMVEETLKGHSEDAVLTLRFAGGVVGHQVFEVEGMPVFEMGEEYVLFVAGNGEAGCPVVGWKQGKLDVRDHPQTGQKIVLDHAGRMLDGVGERNFSSRAGVPGHGIPDHESQIVHGKGEIELLAEEGVTITDLVSSPEERGAKGPAVTVEEFLEDLRHLIRGRSASKTYLAGKVVSSAQAEDMPETFTFRTYPSTAGR